MSDKRRRTLMVLASAAVICGLLAGFAVWRRAAEGLPRYASETVLPGFAKAAKNAARIEITAPGGSFAVAQTPQGWVLPDRGNFPADFDEVRQALISLAQLTTIAPKTARPDWLEHLGLGTPPKGNGTLVTVKDAGGKVLAELITGNVEETNDTSGAKGLFIRKPGEPRALLARAVFPIHGDIGSWMSKRVVDIGPARLKSVTISPASGPGFTVLRATPNDGVSLEGVPPATPVDAQLVNEIGFAVATLQLSDVRPDQGADFTGATHVTATSFDGLSVQLELVQRPDGIWARIRAAGTGATAEQAAATNARAQGRIFRIPDERGRLLLVDRARVLTPPPTMARQGVMAAPRAPGAQ